MVACSLVLPRTFISTPDCDRGRVPNVEAPKLERSERGYRLEVPKQERACGGGFDFNTFDLVFDPSKDWTCSDWPGSE